MRIRIMFPDGTREEHHVDTYAVGRTGELELYRYSPDRNKPLAPPFITIAARFWAAVKVIPRNE